MESVVSSDEDDVSNPMLASPDEPETPEVDDGKFAFRRNKNCSYHMVSLKTKTSPISYNISQKHIYFSHLQIDWVIGLGVHAKKTAQLIIGIDSH